MIRNPCRVIWRASRKNPKNFIRYRAILMIEREIGAPVAKSPMHIASGGPTSATPCFMRVSGIASRCCSRLIELHTDSRHSQVGGYRLIHDPDQVSKVIRRGLCIGLLLSDSAIAVRFSARWDKQR